MVRTGERAGHGESCPYKCLRLGVGVRGDADGLDARRFRGWTCARLLVFKGGADEGGEERMRLERFGLEFGVELAAEEPGVLGGLDYFDVVFVGGAAGDAQSGVGQSFLVVAVEFVAVAMAFANLRFAVSLGGKRTGFEFAGPSAQAHGATHFVDAEKFAQFIDDAMGRLRIAFGSIGLLQPGNVARVFHGGTLHAETDAEIGNLVLAGVLDGVDHSLKTAFAETTWNQNAVVPVQSSGGSGH